MSASLHLHLTFPEHLIDEPILYTLTKDFDVIPNIKRANVDAEFAWAIVELQGDPDDVEAARAWLVDRGVEVAPIEGAP